MTADPNYQPPSANDADDNGNEVPVPDAPPAPGLLNVRFTNQTGDELHFKMKPHTKLAKAMDHYSTRFGRARQTLRFLFEGERVLNETTPTDLDLQDGDTIEVHEEQIGGTI